MKGSLLFHSLLPKSLGCRGSFWWSEPRPGGFAWEFGPCHENSTSSVCNPQLCLPLYCCCCYFCCLLFGLWDFLRLWKVSFRSKVWRKKKKKGVNVSAQEDLFTARQPCWSVPSWVSLALELCPGTEGRNEPITFSWFCKAKEEEVFCLSDSLTACSFAERLIGVSRDVV